MGDFLEGLNTFYETSADANATDAKCTNGIDHYKFFQFSLIPSVIMTIILAMTVKRKEKLLSIMDGRPGLLIPMDSLTRTSRLSYAAAFGSTALLVYQILMDQKFAIDYDGPVSLKTLIAIVSMLIYGTVFFPIFSSLALGTALSYFLGTLFIWTFTAVDFFNVLECDYNATGRAVVIVRNLPSLICHSYLSISLPIRFFMALRDGVYVNPAEDDDDITVDDVKNSYQGKHVRKMLRKPKIIEPPQDFVNKLKASVLGFLHAWIYHVQSGFRYPSRLLSVMVTAGIVVYVITVEFLVWFTSLLDMVLDSLDAQLDYVGRDDQPGDDPALIDYRNGLLVAHYIARLTGICLIVSTVVASLCSFLNILHMLTNFRTNLYAMYRGDYRLIPSPYEKSAASLCVGCLKYAGFQVAYIVWSFLVVFLVLFIICIILAGIITLLKEGFTEWLVDLIVQVWPGLVVTVAVIVIQMVLANKVFLQGDGQYLRLNNRRFFFLFTYFMFFYNIFLGLVSCLLRIIKAIGVGVIFLARLDNSTLPRKFEFFDPGFSAYQGFIHMEAAHTHPVVIVFIQLLKAMQCEHTKDFHKSRTDTSFDVEAADKQPNGIKLTDIELTSHKTEEKKKFSARFNWWVTYTLLQNPQLRIYRKGYFQALQKARKEGIRVPISDLPITEFDLAKMEVDKEKRKEIQAEEAVREKHKLPSASTVSALICHRTNGNVKCSESEEKDVTGEQEKSVIDFEGNCCKV